MTEANWEVAAACFALRDSIGSVGHIPQHAREVHLHLNRADLALADIEREATQPDNVRFVDRA
jgi:hypothetical protein